MSTYREIVFMVNDQLKMVSDDSYYTWDHIKYLVNKFRAYLLKRSYTDIKKEIPISNYQELCIDMSLVSPEYCSGEEYLKSSKQVPSLIEIGNQMILPASLVGNQMSFVSFRRFQNVGFNRFIQNIIYVAIDPEGYLRMTSRNPQFKYLENIKFYGIFEDPEKAYEFTCSTDTVCDVLDNEYPLEEALVPQVIEAVVNELSGAVYKPEDDENNAKDDLSALASYVQRNMKTNPQ